MDCPKDGSAMEEMPLDGVVLDFCPKCSGMWMDWGEMGKVSHGGVTEHELIFRGGSRRMCPRCGKQMRKADLHSVIVEECGCGIFFDKGEAEKVLGRPLKPAQHGKGGVRVEVTAAQLKELLNNGSVAVGGAELVLKR
jgi:uncharacterized protein